MSHHTTTTATDHAALHAAGQAHGHDHEPAPAAPDAGGSHDHPASGHDQGPGADHDHAADGGHDHPADDHDHSPAADHDHAADGGHQHDHGPAAGHDHGTASAGVSQTPVSGHDHGPAAHTHDDDHDHGPGGHDHPASKVPVWLAWLPFLHGHSHEPVVQLDAAASSGEGLRTVFLSFLALSVTAAAQFVVVLLTGSVALLADTIHNFGDALTAIPLGAAFLIGRRVANRRYTFGYGRAEDLAGVAVVALILLSALVAGWESVRRLFDPQPIEYVWVVAGAAIIGFAGNELVAQWRMRVGRRIGSAALIADGEHARVDGFTSLAVLGAVVGTLIGLPILDPLVGLLITVAILKIVFDQGKVMWYRLMDAMDPAVIGRIEHEAGVVDGVQGVNRVRARWVGHQVMIDLYVAVDDRATLLEGHEIAERVRHHLYHEIDHVGDVQVHVDPHGDAHSAAHSLTAHH